MENRSQRENRFGVMEAISDFHGWLCAYGTYLEAILDSPETCCSIAQDVASALNKTIPDTHPRIPEIYNLVKGCLSPPKSLYPEKSRKHTKRVIDALRKMSPLDMYKWYHNIYHAPPIKEITLPPVGDYCGQLQWNPEKGWRIQVVKSIPGATIYNRQATGSFPIENTLDAVFAFYRMWVKERVAL